METVCEKKYARIAIEGGLKKKLVYAVPEPLNDELAVGAKTHSLRNAQSLQSLKTVYRFIELCAMAVGSSFIECAQQSRIPFS